LSDGAAPTYTSTWAAEPGAVWLDRASKPLHDELVGLRVARRSEYRVVFRIDESKHLIVVRRIDHRSSLC
jgi:mRNA-degrading endonuclease RelE of RelBE toxin-antitoxin system